MSLARGSAAWARRAVLAVVLAGTAVIPGYATGAASPVCGGGQCGAAGKVLWARPLPGAWTASDTGGTVLTRGQAYAAAGGQVAAIGFGLTVVGYDIGTGNRLWTTPLSGFPAGASIASVRAWPGVVTAGVSISIGRRGRSARVEVVLRAETGARVRGYRAALYGGGVAAGPGATVIIGQTAVTSYDNRSGKVRWRRRTGKVPQAWRVDGRDLYMTVAAGGYLGTAPVTAIRQISLRTGAQRLIRPHGRSFAGAFSGAFQGVLLFAGARGLTAYSVTTGGQLWTRAGALVASGDELQERLYLTEGGKLLQVKPATGARGKVVPGSSGLFGVRGGVALGLDQGSGGDVWGYSIARQRVIWTTPQLPWPHYFIDLSGIGGSADPASSTVLITSCALVGASAQPGVSQSAAAGVAGSAGSGGPAASGGPTASGGSAGSAGAAASGGPAASGFAGVVQAGPACLRPELVAIRR